MPIASSSVCKPRASSTDDTVKVSGREVDYELISELSPYKYAGYGQLIKTIALEAEDEQLFAKGGGALLAAAVELAEHTLRSSPLNAEELRREKGLEALQVAFDRCVPMVTLSTKPEDMCAEVWFEFSSFFKR